MPIGLAAAMMVATVAFADEEKERHGFLAGASLGAGWSSFQYTGRACYVPFFAEGRVGRTLRSRFDLLAEVAFSWPLNCESADDDLYQRDPAGAVLTAGVQIRPSPRTFLRASGGWGRQDDRREARRASAFHPALSAAAGFEMHPFDNSPIEGEFELRYTGMGTSPSNPLPGMHPGSHGWINSVALNVGFTWYERR